LILEVSVVVIESEGAQNEGDFWLGVHFTIVEAQRVDSMSVLLSNLFEETRVVKRQKFKSGTAALLVSNIDDVITSPLLRIVFKTIDSCCGHLKNTCQIRIGRGTAKTMGSWRGTTTRGT